MREKRTPVYVACRLRPGTLLRHLIGRLLRGFSDIEDVEREALLYGDAARHNKGIEKPKPALLRIAKHLALSRLMRKTRQIMQYMGDSAELTVVDWECSTERKTGLGEELRLHCEAVTDLAPQCRQVYLLRKVHGFSHKEIAAHLGIVVSAVEKHLIKAVEHCDRYVRQTELPLRNTPVCDQRDGHVSVRGRKNGKRRGTRRVDVDPVPGKEVARSDGRR
jgi:DNA-directed RNA polymerase specialized sigma24 family protein